MRNFASLVSVLLLAALAGCTAAVAPVPVAAPPPIRPEQRGAIENVVVTEASLIGPSSASQGRELSGLEKEFSDLMTMPPLTAALFPDLRLQVVNASFQNQDEVRSVLLALRKAKSAGTDFSAITRVEFVSSTKALVDFLWSGGMHGGQFTLEKRGPAWEIVREGYAF
jgi:hypothetical protein